VTVLPIQAAGATVGTLRLVTPTPETAARLGRWREQNAQWFLTQFRPSVERTLHWLRAIVAPDPTRRLFVVHDADERPVGTIGVLHLDRDPIEVDNILRGDTCVTPHLMTHALASAITWLFEQSPARAINLFVLSDNARAIRLYERLGFTHGARYELTREERGDEVHLHKAATPHPGVPTEQHLLEMRLERGALRR
jgi:RimJ/RimL family protein N-acetyltransferase